MSTAAQRRQLAAYKRKNDAYREVDMARRAAKAKEGVVKPIKLTEKERIQQRGDRPVFGSGREAARTNR